MLHREGQELSDLTDTSFNRLPDFHFAMGIEGLMRRCCIGETVHERNGRLGFSEIEMLIEHIRHRESVPIRKLLELLKRLV
jgi:hypothetical protein